MLIPCALPIPNCLMSYTEVFRTHEMLALPLGTLLERCPDLTHEEIVLVWGSDTSRQEAHHIVSGVAPEEKKNQL